MVTGKGFLTLSALGSQITLGGKIGGKKTTGGTQVKGKKK